MKGDAELKRAKIYLEGLAKASEFLMTSDRIKDEIEPSTLKIIRDIIREKLSTELEEYQLLLDSQNNTRTWSENDDEALKKYLLPLDEIAYQNWREEWRRIDNLVLLLGRSKSVIKKHAIALGLDKKLIAP